MGEEKEKSRFLTATLMASIWSFWWKAPLDPSTQTTVNSRLLPWHNHSSVLPFLQSASHHGGIIGGLCIALSWADWSASTDQQANNREKELTLDDSCFGTPLVWHAACLWLYSLHQRLNETHRKALKRCLFRSLCFIFDPSSPALRRKNVSPIRLKIWYFALCFTDSYKNAFLCF